jgi:hypothetical protein
MPEQTPCCVDRRGWVVALGGGATSMQEVTISPVERRQYVWDGSVRSMHVFPSQNAGSALRPTGAEHKRSLR